MDSIKAIKKITAGILAHVDAGKTTLSEALLYRAGMLRKLGRVDHRDTFLDTHALERDRGITIFSKQARIHTDELDLTLLDTPGHADLSGETERAIAAMDIAILVISGTDGVQAHTETLWSLLLRSRIPTWIFVTKMDADLDADTFITCFDDDPGYEVISESEPVTENGITFRFVVYGRKENKE